MTTTSSNDPITLYSRLDPIAVADTPAPDSRATVALFEKITTDYPREQETATAHSDTWRRFAPTGFRVKRPMFVALPIMAVVVVALVAVSVVAPIGTSSAVAEVEAAATRTAAFDSGRISRVFTVYSGDERVGSSSIDYRFSGEDFDYRNSFDADMIEHLQGADLGDLVEDQGTIEFSDVTIEPETLIRKVDGDSYFGDGSTWSRGVVPGTDLGDVEDRALAATHATSDLTSCEGPAGFDSYCGTSDDVDVLAALLLTDPVLLTADTDATIRIDIDESTGLVHAVHATLTSDREAEVVGITRTEVTVTLTDLGTGQPIEAPPVAAPTPSSETVDLEIEVPGVDGTCSGSGPVDEALQAIVDCLVDNGVDQNMAELIAQNLE